MARKARKLDDGEIAQVEALAAYLSQEQIADYFGIGRTTWYAILDRQPKVAEHYKKGKAKAIGKIAQSLIKQAMDGDKVAAMFYLKTQAGWRETQGHDHTSSDGSMTPSIIERVIVRPESKADE